MVMEVAGKRVHMGRDPGPRAPVILCVIQRAGGFGHSEWMTIQAFRTPVIFWVSSNHLWPLMLKALSLLYSVVVRVLFSVASSS